MSFIRRKQVRKKTGTYYYYYRVESVREGNTVKQVVLDYLGTGTDAIAAIEALDCSEAERAVLLAKMRSFLPDEPATESPVEELGITPKQLGTPFEDEPIAIGSRVTFSLCLWGEITPLEGIVVEGLTQVADIRADGKDSTTAEVVWQPEGSVTVRYQLPGTEEERLVQVPRRSVQIVQDNIGVTQHEKRSHPLHNQH